MSKKKGIAILIALVVLAANIFILMVRQNVEKIKDRDFINFMSKGKLSEENIVEEGDASSKIAVVDVLGVISEGERFDYLMESLERIRSSSQVKAVIVYIDSPGGGVYEAARVADKIMQIKEEKNIPFYASMGRTATSGGYYIAAVCDKIYASKETVTGSIGVIMSSLNFSGLFEKYGVKAQVIKSGKFKDIGANNKPMTESDKVILQGLIDNSYDNFVNVVAEGRNIPVSSVKRIADGRIYDGSQALRLKLIDDIGYYEDVLHAVKRDLNLENPQIVTYEFVETFGGFLSLLRSSVIDRKKTEVEKAFDVLKEVDRAFNMAPMYLYGGM